jgi:hypothetical protein
MRVAAAIHDMACGKNDRDAVLLRLVPGYAKAAGGEAADDYVCCGESGGGAVTLPVFWDEGAGDGDGAVVLHKGMQAHDAGKQAEEAVGRDISGEIVDEPAVEGVGFQPLKEADDFVVGEMVGEERSDDEMRMLVGGVGEDVAGDPLNAACGRAGFRGDGGGVGVEVEAGEFDGYALSLRALFDTAEGVTVAGADVEDAEGRVGAPGSSLVEVEGFEPVQSGAVTEKHAVDPG